MKAKNDIRQRLLKIRRTLREEEVVLKSSMIIGNLKEYLKDISQISNILVYLPIQNEPDLKSLYRYWLEQKYRLFAPVIKSKNEFFPYPLTCLDDIVPGPLQTIQPAPRGHKPQPYNFDLILIPGVAFDLSGNRLGFGKGFFDRFLSKARGLKIGICYEFQIIEKLPAEKNDIPVDIIITEKRALSVGAFINKGG